MQISNFPLLLKYKTKEEAQEEEQEEEAEEEEEDDEEDGTEFYDFLEPMKNPDILIAFDDHCSSHLFVTNTMEKGSKAKISLVP